MEKLDLSENTINDEAAKSVAEAITNIKKLSLERCRLSSHGITSIMNGIGSLSQPMEEFDLSENHINDEASKSLAEAITNIKKLSLEGCRLSRRGITSIMNGIGLISHPMEELNLGWNSIDNEAAKSVANAIFNIKKLSLKGCALSRHGIPLIMNGIESLSQPMKKLDLGCITIDDEAAKSLAEAITNIKKLSLERCRLSSHGITFIMNRIGSLSHPMEKLDLGGNFIDDEASKSLAEAITNIKKLSLMGCRLSSHGITLIMNGIGSLSQPMKDLDLSENSVDDEAAKSVARAIFNVKKLHVQHCNLSEKATAMIQKKIWSLSLPGFDETSPYVPNPFYFSFHKASPQGPTQVSLSSEEELAPSTADSFTKTTGLREETMIQLTERKEQEEVSMPVSPNLKEEWMTIQFTKLDNNKEEEDLIPESSKVEEAKATIPSTNQKQQKGKNLMPESPNLNDKWMTIQFTKLGDNEEELLVSESSEVNDVNTTIQSTKREEQEEESSMPESPNLNDKWMSIQFTKLGDKTEEEHMMSKSSKIKDANTTIQSTNREEQEEKSLMPESLNLKDKWMSIQFTKLGDKKEEEHLMLESSKVKDVNTTIQSTKQEEQEEESSMPESLNLNDKWMTIQFTKLDDKKE